MPVLLECCRADGKKVEVVAKLSSGTFEKEKNLAIEALVALLAADLELPVPEPFVVEISDEFIDALLVENEVQTHFRSGNRLAFGSRVLQGYSSWLNGQNVPEALVTRAAEIFTFDVIVVNADRNPKNPNCLFSGVDFAIIDHELTLNQQQVLFWKEPWHDEGFGGYLHIFNKPNLSCAPQNLDRFRDAWEKITTARIKSYFDAIPPEWSLKKEEEDRLFSYLCKVKSEIESVIGNALKALQ